MPAIPAPIAPTESAAFGASALCAAPVCRLRRASLIALLASAVSSGARADLVALVAASRRSVLPVGTFNPLGSPRFAFRGSGFIVDDGTLLITNAHVLPDPASSADSQMAVLLPSPPDPSGQASDGREVRRATVLRVDRLRDLALLRVEGAPLPALPLAEPNGVKEGLSVALIGFPIGGVLGFSPVTHRGIVASITTMALPSTTARQLDERMVARLREGPLQVYQLDATADPGNSGGPLLDADTGRVVGVVNMVLVRSTRESALSSPTGISYAIPVRFVRELLQASR